MKYYCPKCSKLLDEVKLPRCECGTVYDLLYDYNNPIKDLLSNRPITHWKYRALMPINYHNTRKILSMGEGGTPLLNLNRISPDNVNNLYFKCEFMNPTGSFKDRASALEITLAQGYDEIVVATTGNMGASLAAYAALAEMDCTVFIPRSIHNTKIEQMKMYGAKIIEVDGDYNDALKAAEAYHTNTPTTVTLRLPIKYSTISRKNTYLAGDYGIRVEGTKSVGYEISEQLEWGVPDYIFVPVGNGTLLYAIHKAFRDLFNLGITKSMPKIVGIKSDNPENTIASAIACTKPLFEHHMNIAHRIITVSDEEIMDARRLLARNGLFVEPGGAAAYAGLMQIEKDISGDVVVLLTGNGLKGI